MMFRTHILFAIFFYLLTITILSINPSITFVLILSFGAILPHIDHPKSFVNKNYLFGIGKGISMFSTHRGFFHSVFGALIFFLISLLFIYFINISIIYPIALLCGYLLHLLADSFNVSGIKWFWKIGHINGPIRTASMFEQIFFFILIVLTFYLIIGNQGFHGITAFISKIKP